MNNIAGVSNFACYYGPNRLERIAAYDLVILQADHYTPDALNSLRTRGVCVVAYLSIGEAPRAEAEASWVLRDPVTGSPVHNAEWGTALVDCRSEAWQARLLEVDIPRLLALRVDGFFLDTVDVQEQFPVTRPAVQRLLMRIRGQLPQATLLVNRGFAILDTVLKVADGVVFEAFTSYHDGTIYRAWTEEDLAWTARMATKLTQTLGGKPVLTIDYAAPDDLVLREKAERRARAYGFVPFVGTRHLDWLP